MESRGQREEVIRPTSNGYRACEVGFVCKHWGEKIVYTDFNESENGEPYLCGTCILTICFAVLCESL